MTIDRRQFLVGAGTIALATTAGGRAFAQGATLSVPWMGWPEEQVRPLMAAFEEQTGNTIREERLPIAELFRTLEVRLTARNETPDVYLVDGPLTASYAARGHLLDLSEIIEPQRDRFLETTLRQGTWDDTVYSAPLGTSSQVLFCNRALFEEAGIPLPSTDPAERMTWEEALDIARELARPDEGRFGFGFENSNPYQLLPIPQSRGVQVISDDGLTASGYVDSDGMADAMQWYQDLFQTHGVSPAGVFDGGLMQEMFGAGQLAMMVGGNWNLSGLHRFDGLDFVAVPHPYFAGGTPVTPTGSWHVGINPRTAQMEASRAFVEWLLVEDTMKFWFELRSYPPSLHAIWAEWSDTVFADPAWSIVQHELANTAMPRPLTPGYREYEEFLRVAMRDIQSGADVREALSTAASSIDREMRKYR